MSAAKVTMLSLLATVAPSYRGIAAARQAELDAAAAKVEAPAVDAAAKVAAAEAAKAREAALDAEHDRLMREIASQEATLAAFIQGARFGRER